MRKYGQILKYEMKNIVKDKMTLMMFVYPPLMLVFSVLLIPKLLESAEGNQTALMYGSIISFLFFISIGTFMTGVLYAFVLLDRKDEKTIHTIAVTPLSVAGYIRFLSIYKYILTVLMNIVILVGTKLLASDAYSYTLGGITVNLFGDLTYGKIMVFSFVSALFMPAIGLFLSGLANNKIEGFAYMKMSGFLIFIPILMVFSAFDGNLQYVLGIAPNFWAIKGLYVSVIQRSESDLSFFMYMLIGALYSILLLFPSYKFYIRRSMRT